MTFLSQIEKQRLRDRIRQIETKTRGEIVTVIVAASGGYLFYPTLWAALLAILSPLLPIALDVSFAPLGIIELQLVVFLFLALGFRWRPLKRYLVPRTAMRTYCARRAREQFVAQNLHTTRDRTGVLLYVSVFERHVELLADTGIHAKVAPGTWDQIVAQFIQKVKASLVAEGFIEAIEAIGQELAIHFPAEENNPNELPDHLVEL